MKITISANQFLELIKKSFSIDYIFLLKLINENSDIAPLCEDSVKVAMLHQTLIRKGLINDEGNKLTTLGQELVLFVDTKDSIKLPKKKDNETDFDRWWKEYRATDNILLKDKTGNSKDDEILFLGSRGLKVKRDDCRTKFNAILLEGDYTVEDLIRALHYEIDSKIQKSIETKQNKLSYMQNSLTYLTQKTYENFIEISKSNIKNNYNSGGTEI
jgi:hypothetical protein